MSDMTCGSATGTYRLTKSIQPNSTMATSPAPCGRSIDIISTGINSISVPVRLAIIESLSPPREGEGSTSGPGQYEYKKVERIEGVFRVAQLMIVTP